MGIGLELTFLPIESKYALVYAQFKYPDRKSDFHSSQKTFAIQKPTTIVK
jgi:hypothetical protein